MIKKMSKLYFIINPKAGNGKAKLIWSVLEKKLISSKIQFMAFFTEKNGHGKQLAAHIIDNTDENVITIIVVGGDGTLNEVINGSSYKLENVRIGLIPGGSGNDFSRGFSIPSDPDDALKVLLRLVKQEVPSFDVGKIIIDDNREHFFINSTGAGFDALISYEANHSSWKGLLNRFSLGQFVYVILLLKNLFTFKCSTVDLIINGKKQTFPKTWFVTVSNQPYYGGGMKIAPHALANDGELNVTVVHNLSRLKLLLVFLSVFWGKHLGFKEVNHFLARTISIQSSEPFFVHSDGEPIGSTPLQISIHPEPISILTRQCLVEIQQEKEMNIK
ncbi:diacylglycerol/lipid kinase family protein [Bacillus sp. CGMCC 1.16607]|uniref:diacylglycerol/lipid kinase family protein n=1 Tax=Bacillus sp. CGMCC 1.16607 TaxID=3351842 RepID=UPI003638FD17